MGDYNVLKKEDFEKSMQAKFKTKTILRPDKIVLTANKNALKIPVSVTNCSFNGKCFELLAETKNGNSLILYSNKKVESDKELIAYVEIRK